VNIFVSYTTRNNEVTANLLVNLSNKINSIGNVFVDLINNNSEDKQGRVVEELEKSNLLILIDSPSILHSSWVNFELRLAEKFKIPVVKFSIFEIDVMTSKEIETRISRCSLRFLGCCSQHRLAQSLIV
jgi:hypothetical protein